MSYIMGDVVAGRLSPPAANAAINAGGKLLKVVELQIKYGTPEKGIGRKDLPLADVE